MRRVWGLCEEVQQVEPPMAIIGLVQRNDVEEWSEVVPRLVLRAKVRVCVNPEVFNDFFRRRDDWRARVGRGDE